MRIAAARIVFGIAIACVGAGGSGADERVSTFSIVAFDPETGDLGVAVASRSFAVGHFVPWLEVGVGAIATQAAINVEYGRRGIELLRRGMDPEATLKKMIEADDYPRKDGRQVAIVDGKGRIAAYTGENATPWAGHVEGANYSAQGNTLAGPEVVQGIARGFQQAGGELAEKLMAGIEGGHAAGGDRRGMQGAALMVVRRNGGRGYGNDRYIDLRVDDHVEAIPELRRLLNVQLAMNLVAEAKRALVEEDLPGAQARFERAARLAPGTALTGINLGLMRYVGGDAAGALDLLRQVREREAAVHFRSLVEFYARGTPPFERALKDPGFADLLYRE